MIVTLAPKVEQYCCSYMHSLVQSGDVVLHYSKLAFKYVSISTGEERFFDLAYCPKCGQKIELDTGRPAMAVAAASIAPVQAKTPLVPVAENTRVRSRDNHVMAIALLLGVGAFIFVQLAFGIISDLVGGGTTAVAEQQCNTLYTAGNAPMYSCGPEAP